MHVSRYQEVKNNYFVCVSVSVTVLWWDENKTNRRVRVETRASKPGWSKLLRVSIMDRGEFCEASTCPLAPSIATTPTDLDTNTNRRKLYQLNYCNGSHDVDASLRFRQLRPPPSIAAIVAMQPVPRTRRTPQNTQHTYVCLVIRLTPYLPLD